MKRYLLCIFIIILIIQSGAVGFAESAIKITQQMGYGVDDFYQPKGGSILVDAATGAILWEEDAHTKWTPASVSKVITLYLAYQAMERGEFSEDTVVYADESVHDLSTNTTLSNNYMPVGAAYRISELIDLIVAPSSAAATMLLANQMASHAEMVEQLNITAQNLGMEDTHYDNIIGAPNHLLGAHLPEDKPPQGDNQSSAFDQTILAMHFLKEHPQILEHTKHPVVTIHPGTDQAQSFGSPNHSLEGAGYPLAGMDGLKTGSSGPAGFNIVMTAQRENTRFVGAIMGVGSWDVPDSEVMRSLIANSLMEKHFQEYEYKLVLPQGQHTIEGEEIITDADLYDIVPKNSPVQFRLEKGGLLSSTAEVLVDLERKYLPGYEAPRVNFQLANKAITADETEPTDGAPTPENPEPPSEAAQESQLKKSIVTLSLYLLALLVLLLIVRSVLLRKLRNRMNKRQRRR